MGDANGKVGKHATKPRDALSSHHLRDANERGALARHRGSGRLVRSESRQSLTSFADAVADKGPSSVPGRRGPGQPQLPHREDYSDVQAAMWLDFTPEVPVPVLPHRPDFLRPPEPKPKHRPPSLNLSVGTLAPAFHSAYGLSDELKKEQQMFASKRRAERSPVERPTTPTAPIVDPS